MKVGDIGVLQNFFTCQQENNGQLAEIVAPLGVYDWTDYNLEHGRSLGYRVKMFHQKYPLSKIGVGWHIDTNQIRPLSDPDAEKIFEEEMTA